MNDQQAFALREALKGSSKEIDAARVGPFSVWGSSREATFASADVEGVLWERLLKVAVEDRFDASFADDVIHQLVELARADGYLAQSSFNDVKVSSEDEEIDGYDKEMFLLRSESPIRNLDPRPNTFFKPNGFLLGLITSYTVLDQHMTVAARNFFESLSQELVTTEFEELAASVHYATQWRRPLLNILMSAYGEGVEAFKTSLTAAPAATAGPRL